MAGGNISQLPLLDESLAEHGDTLPPGNGTTELRVALPPSDEPHSLKTMEPVRHAAGLSSRTGLLHAEVQYSGESSTINHPERHENPGIEMSTIASPAPLAQQDTMDIPEGNEQELEPGETDSFIQQQPSNPSDSAKKTEKKDKSVLKGLISKLSPNVKKEPSLSGSSADKDVKRNPQSEHLSVSGDKSKPPKLLLADNQSPKSPDAPGSLLTPQTKSPAQTDKPELGSSPVTKDPKNVQNKQHVTIKDNKQSAVSTASEADLPGNKPISGTDGIGGGDGKRGTSHGSAEEQDKAYLGKINLVII